MTPEQAALRIAEAISREEQRRARDVANAIADFEAAEGDRKTFEGMSLIAASRSADQRFNVVMARESQAVIEETAGQSLDDLIGTDGEFGLGISPSGDVAVIDGEGKPLELEPGDDPDTTPVGESEIPGIDLSLTTDDEMETE